MSKKSSKRAILVTNGTCSEPEYYRDFIMQNSSENSILIGIDGGSNILRDLGIVPNLILGDMDSISKENYNYFAEQDTEFLIFPKNKDKTDTQIAIEHAIENGFNEIYVINETGNRLDHFISNIYMLVKFYKQVDIKIVNNRNLIFLSDSEFELEGHPGQYISLIPLNEKVTAASSEGLKFPIIDTVLIRGETTGVSNEFIEDTCFVKISSGTLIVILSKD